MSFWNGYDDAFSRMGAKCTGVDLSDDAIQLAREINDETKA
jgi:hypothetical protein